MSARPRVVVLGGGGFIGSHVAGELDAAGYPVRLFSRGRRGWGGVAHLPDRVARQVGDLGDPAAVRRALDGCEVVVHLAGTGCPADSDGAEIADAEANLLPTLRLLDELRARAGGARVVFASSGGTVYGRAQALPIPEDHPTVPLCSYGLVKLTIERYLALHHHLHGLDYTVLRF